MDLLTCKKIKLINLFIAGILFILAILWLFILSQLHYRCPIHELLGIWCPGCGGTRMVISIINLDFYQAFRWNPLLFILFITFIIYLIVCVVFYIKKRVIPIPTIKFFIILCILLVIYMIVRNISVFSYLIPTNV